MPFVGINTAVSGQGALVAAVVGRKIRVINYGIIASGAVTVKFQSASTDLTGAMSIAANGGISASGTALGPNGFFGLFETASGEALNINLGGAIQVSGHLGYVVI